MAATPEAPTAEQVAAHYHESLVRKRSARRLMWGMIFGLVLLAMLAPVALYIAWLAHGRALLREELVKIESAGEPITTAEMTAWHQVPEGKRDITQLWLDAIRPFETPAFSASAKALPIVGTGGALPWVGQPLPAADEEAIRAWLQLQQPLMAAVRFAAKQDGEVRYPREFGGSLDAFLGDIQALRSTIRAFDLEFEILARAADLEPALANLETRFAIGETLRGHPTVIDLLVRIAIQSVSVYDIRALAATDRLNDEQLARLQQMLRNIDLQGDLPAAFLGERAMCYQAFHQKLGLMIDPDQIVFAPVETTNDVTQVSRPEDCAYALASLFKMLEASREPFPQLFDAAARLQAEQGQQTSGQLGTINEMRFAGTASLLPSLTACANAIGRYESTRRCLDATLAARRYYLQHGQPPQRLADLVPDFLPEVPLDPYTGQPLLMLVDAQKVTIYSVGRDRVDDNGLTSLPLAEPDIAEEMLLPTPKK